jgi:HD superfamily phosphohydrolase
VTVIKDPVHDHIELSPLATALLDTPAMQRLRRIRQLGTVTYVYPAANHTRFEHSLGVYHLCEAATAKLAERGEMERVAARPRELEAAALLHDIGHAPFSHNVESVFERRLGLTHEDIADVVGTGEVARVLERHGIEPDRVVRLVAGDLSGGEIVSGELDVDRMDYLNRDAHHTGVPYGTVEHQRLIRALRFDDDGGLVLEGGNTETAESLLVARALMSKPVYNHSVARIGKAVLRRATERLIDRGGHAAADVRRMDDPRFLTALRDCDATAEYVRRLDVRDLHKIAIWARWSDVPETIRDADRDTVRGWEREIADRAGLPVADVVVDVPAAPTMEESSTRIRVGGETHPLADRSPLVAALERKVRDQWRLGIYATEESVDEAASAGAAVLGLDLDANIAERRPVTNATLDRFAE